MLTNTLKTANAKLKFFTKILLAIMFTTSSNVKYRMLHVMRDADDISRVKPGELHPDVLFADVIRKIEFWKMNVLYLLISYGDLYSNFACSIVLQISCIIEKIKKFYNAKKIIFEKTAFSQFKKNWHYRIFLNFAK